METTAQAQSAAKTLSIPSTVIAKPLLSRLLPYLLVAPTLILVLVFTVLPALNSIVASLTKPGRRPADPVEFVGLQNYLDLFNPTHFIGANFVPILGNTILFALATVILSLPLSLGLALLLNRKIRGLWLWRFSIFYPALLPVIGAASIWAFLYSDTVGLINTVLRSLGMDGPNWIGDPNLVLWAVIIVNVWKQAGYYMIFYLAGLQNIPRDLYEAADLDGATSWQSLIYLTLPLLQRTTLFILVVAFTFAFQTVEQLQVLGQGGPGTRGNLMLYYIFQSIGERRNWGYVNAMTVLLVSILMVFTVTNFVFFERKGEE
jgi:sn-glycerol 3-phosphate transport system permease protein